MSNRTMKEIQKILNKMDNDVAMTYCLWHLCGCDIESLAEATGEQVEIIQQRIDEVDSKIHAAQICIDEI